MSIPAGWYDDGSGRQRWWDGTRWTDQVAPPGSHSASYAPTGAPAADTGSPGYPHAPAKPQRSSVLGFTGLGLAVLGTILVCIPTVVTSPIGLVLLLAAFVVSLIAVFQKNTKKWPSITGIILSILGSIIGIILFATMLLFGITDAVSQAQPRPDPAPTTNAQPTEEPTQPTDEPPTNDDNDDGRPSPEAIAEGLETIAHAGGMFEYDDVPGYFLCVGQYYYDSDLSDESLQGLSAGDDVTGAERDMGIQVAYDATGECDPSM